MAKKLLSVARARALLDYDPSTGMFTWKIYRGPRARAGSTAGAPHPGGYRCIRIDGTGPYLAHRVAWLMTYGEWPAGDIDHVNGDRSDNRIANLRLADRFQNGANAKVHLDNLSGFKGVSQMRGRYQARIRVRGQSFYLGSFLTPEEAHGAYVAAARRLSGAFARAA